MKVVTLNDISLINSSIPEDLYKGSATINGLWTEAKAAAGDYDTGAQIYYNGVIPHRVYTSLVDNNTATPGTDASQWTNNGATDRHLIFDQFMETQSFYDQEFWHEVDASNSNYIGVFRAVAKEITFTHFLNTQLLTDGDCSSDSFDKGDGFSYDSGNMEYDCDGTQTANSKLSQASITTENENFFIKFTIKNWSAGTVAGIAGGTVGASVSGNGDYAQDITAGSTGDAGVVVSDDFVGSITDLSTQEVLKSETIDMDGSILTDWESYFLAPQEYREGVTWSFTRFYNSTIRVTVTYISGADAKAGIMPIGYATEAGDTLCDPDIGAIDFSKKDTDTDFGYTYLKEGSYADDGKFKVWLSNTTIDLVKRLLIKNRGKSCVLDFNNAGTNYESFVYYCVIGPWRVSIPGDEFSRLTIEATGLI